MNQHVKLFLKDEGRDLYVPRKCQSWGYRYGPTIMVHNGICEAWFASPGDGFEADWFTYRRSEDNGRTWTEEKVVMSPVPNSMDWFSVCDPAVIKYGDYYYIGYTSTVFANGGGVGNNGFIARSKSPTGPFERFCGDGWGETRQDGDRTLHWAGKPYPVIYFDEDWRTWGAGEFSFVVKDTTVYAYYTWASVDSEGHSFRHTRVATADITHENWPGELVERGVASDCANGDHDSMDVVYCEDLDKFIALTVSWRFTDDSVLAVYESDDGLHFTRVNEIKAKTSWRSHNCGISGDELHHIRLGDTMLLAYAYGNQWGMWGTRLHEYGFTAMEEPFFTESAEKTVCRPIEKADDPQTFEPSFLTLQKPHYLRVKTGDSTDVPLVVGNVAYQMKPVPDGVTFGNYDTSVVSIDGGRITGKRAGMTYVTAAYRDFTYEFPVYVSDETPHEWCTFGPYPDKTVVSFTPVRTAYTASLASKELKQIRGIAVYEDDSWFELSGDADKVLYRTDRPDLIRLDEFGRVYPTGTTGTASVTVSCGTHSFDVTFTVLP